MKKGTSLGLIITGVAMMAGGVNLAQHYGEKGREYKKNIPESVYGIQNEVIRTRHLLASDLLNKINQDPKFVETYNNSVKILKSYQADLEKISRYDTNLALNGGIAAIGFIPLFFGVSGLFGFDNKKKEGEKWKKQ